MDLVEKSTQTKPTGGKFSVATLVSGAVGFAALLLEQQIRVGELGFWVKFYRWVQFSSFAAAAFLYCAGVVLLSFALARSLQRGRLLTIPGVALILCGGLWAYEILSRYAFKHSF